MLSPSDGRWFTGPSCEHPVNVILLNAWESGWGGGEMRRNSKTITIYLCFKSYLKKSVSSKRKGRNQVVGKPVTHKIKSGELTDVVN